MEKVVIGNCTLYHGDCLEVMKDIEFNHVVTDPPYLINYKSGRVKGRDMKPIENDNNSDFIDNFFNALFKKDFQNLMCFGSIKKYSYFENIISKHLTIRNTIIWNKIKTGMGGLEATFASQYEIIIYANKERYIFNGYRFSDIWNVVSISKKKRQHQNQKPIPLMKQCIIPISKENDIIFDPFMGSGSTGVACINTNRKFIGIELQKDYFDISVKRIKDAHDNKQHELF